MTKWLLTVALAAVGGAAVAQYPQVGGAYPYAPLPANVTPNFYNRGGQPLSPYLNLLRGGNTGVNYFYGVRPGTIGGAVPTGGGFGLTAGGSGAMRPNTLPTTLAQTLDPIPIPPAGSVMESLAPTGRPARFVNGPGAAPPGTGAARPGFAQGAPPPAGVRGPARR